MNIGFCGVLFLLNIVCLIKGNGVRLQSLGGSAPGWAYQGHLNKGERVIKVIPELRGVPSLNISKTMEICGFYIHYETLIKFPFLIAIIDKKLGNAKLQLKPEVKFEDLEDRYTFQIEAYDCDQPPHFSERRFVLIEVGSVNGPEFLRPTYQFTVNTSLPVGSKIGEVVAIERPPTERLSSTVQGICRYDIISASPVPFTVNQYGSLYSKELRVSSEINIKYRFYVRATDCNVFQPRKVSVPVIVEVYDNCQIHWTELPNRLQYIRNGGVLPVVKISSKTPSLHICSNSCSNFQIVLTARLLSEMTNIAKTEKCKQDSESIKKQARICDGSVNTIDLLKDAPKSIIDPISGAYYFNSVQDTIDLHLKTDNLILSKTFTISFWMKHGNMNLNNPKQHILCNSDSNVMNRHHFSLFLHNCKIILLIRKEYWEISKEQYQPTEWRFGPLREVCDFKWHHYGIMFHDKTIALQIDGEIWQGSPDVLVEKPLANLINNNQKTRFSIGSCYHSKTNSHVQHFYGYLAGLHLLNNSVEPVNTIRCMAMCGESLLLPHISDSIDSGSSVILFSDSAVLKTSNIYDLLAMFSKLSYVNTNELGVKFDTKEKNRNITINTEIKCDSGRIINAPMHTITLEIIQTTSSVKKVIQPSVIIYSQSKVNGYIKKPVILFPNVKFIYNNQSNNTLKSCIIRPVNHPIQSFEYLNWPIDMAINSHLTSLNNTHGLMLDGKQSPNVFESLIRKITYVAQKIDTKHSQRKFGLICAIEENIVTNELIVKVVVKEENLNTYYIVDDPEEDKNDRSNNYHALRSGNNRQGFEDKLLVSNKVEGGVFIKKRDLWIVIPIIAIVSVGFLFGILIYFKRQKMQRKLIQKNLPEEKSNKLVQLKLIKSSKEKKNQFIRNISHRDTDSINSDCPDSGDDHDGMENDQFNKFSDDEKLNKRRANRVSIPEYISLPSKIWKKQSDQPVNV